MTQSPRIRAVEAFPVQQDGKTLVYLKDPLNFAPPLGISPVGYFILTHFDGRHTLVDVQEAYCRQFGTLLMTDDLKEFIEMLDRHYYLHSERFLSYQKSVVDEFRALPTRAAMHAGRVYQQEAEQLKVQLEGYFRAPGGPGLPARENQAATPKAIVAPHIDFHRGGPAYAWAYKRLAESSGAELYIVLGTSHCSGEQPFILTYKDFETPLGVVETDKEFVQRLQHECGEDYLTDEYLHRGEHSLEFQVLFLKYTAQRRAAMTRQSDKPFKIVPILVSSFHSMINNQTLPENNPQVGRFLSALRALAESESREVCFVAGVDLAHVGRQFGDRETIDSSFLSWVQAEDRRLIDRLAALDAPGFFAEIAKDRDRRRICGFAPLYSLVHLLNGSRGNQLHYGQAFTPETGSAVTFTSMVFE